MKILDIANSQLGKEETPRGSNWGEPVKSYLATVGIDFPASWCMAFVHWCSVQAFKNTGVKNPLIKTGGVLRQWNEINGYYKHKEPQAGDIFIMDFGGGHGHTGFVSAVNGNKIETIEGNSNDTGSREGYEVCAKPGGRLISSCVGFIRLPSL